jgi:hypothetical protein
MTQKSRLLERAQEGPLERVLLVSDNRGLVVASAPFFLLGVFGGREGASDGRLSASEGKDVDLHLRAEGLSDDAITARARIFFSFAVLRGHFLLMHAHHDLHLSAAGKLTLMLAAKLLGGPSGPERGPLWPFFFAPATVASGR